MEWKHREKAKYLTAEANWIIRHSHAMQNVGFVFKGVLIGFQKKDLSNPPSHH